MVWNKTPQEVIDLIIKELVETTDSHTTIAARIGKSPWLVSEVCRKHVSKEIRQARKIAQDKVAKTGDKNPMWGLKGFKHHGAVEESRVMGYRTAFVPDWWEGKKVRPGRIYEHHLVYCSHHGMTSIPKGHVVHHIDHNKDNNDISNLQLMTISEHMRHHMTERHALKKVQRLSGNGVENSVLEAPSTQEEG
jgi:hypothetical protein